MSEAPGQYQPTDERDRLFDECIILLRAIRRKHASIKLLKGVKATLQLYANYKSKPNQLRKN